MRIKGFFLSSSSIFLALAASPALAAIQPPAPADPNAQAAQGQAGSPAAADATTQTTEEANSDQAIVVTGLRRSLQSSRNIRRNSEQIIDSVVAEDIGKLPDLNTAETAARIPGVQVYRQGGEAQNVLVRGLPNFTTTYNGREIFTAETHVVALQDFPSANIAALEVFKTSTADLVEPGLAGLVNVRSRRPFDFSGGQFAGSVWALDTRQGGKVKPNFNLLATQRWNTGIGEIGLLVNVSYTEMRYLDAEISNTDFIADPTVNGQHIRLPDIQRLFYRSGDRIRPSVNAALQWRPSASVEIYAEGLWQGFRNRIDDRLLEADLFGGQSYSNIVLRPNSNLVSSGTVVGHPQALFSFQGGTYNTTDTFQFATGAHIHTNRLHIDLDLARSRSVFRGSTESIDRRWAGAPTINFNNEKPSFTISGIDFSDPSQQIFSGLFEENQRAAGQDWQARADLTYDFESPILRSIQAGARYTDRNAQRNDSNRFAFLLPLGLNASTLPVTFDVFHGVDFQATNAWAAPVYDSIRANATQLRQFVITHCPQILPSDPGNGCASYTTSPIVPALIFTAHETTLAGYGQINLGNDNVNGVIGVRVNRVRTRVAGPVPTGVTAEDNGTEHTDILPNASFKVRLSPEFQIRAAVSKTRTRPEFPDLVPSVSLVSRPNNGTVGTASDPFIVRGGDPFLHPFTSWNYDAALEYYFSRTGFASLTGFHRSLNGFIQPSTFRFTDPVLGVVEVTGPVNTGKGRINGAEFQVQSFFDFHGLPEWAKGFGIQANVTYVDAKTQVPNDAGTALVLEPIIDQLNGVSKWNYSLVGLYEKNGLSARLTFNGRSSFAATRQNRGDDIYTETAHPANRLDLSLNYNILSNATIFADWTNITRTPFRQDFSSARAGAPRADYVRYLRYDESTVSLGFRFKFGS